jgi:hypothetical protein
MRAKYSNVIAKGKDLPTEYIDALVHFRYYLKQAAQGPIALLKAGVPSSPMMRPLFIREPHVSNSTIMKVRSREAAGKHKIVWLFGLLWDQQQSFLYGLPNIMDELDLLIQRDTTQKQLVSPWVADVISDLSTVSECLRQVELHHPFASTMEDQEAKILEDLKINFAKSTSQMAKLMEKAKGLSFNGVGTPSGDTFSYPVDKPKTAERVKVMRRAEDNLDRFWEMVDQVFGNNPGQAEDPLSWRVMYGDRRVQRIPEWTEPTPGTDGRRALEPVELPYIPFQQMSLEGSTPAAKPPKAKTRGTTQSSETTEPAVPATATNTTKPITMTKRAFKVFTTLFHQPNQSSQPGSIPWADFLHAMATTGFQPEKLYGSVWQFTPTTRDVDRSILFHEPHPGSRIPFRTARRMGRRLQRAFGWEGGIFTDG